MPHTPFDLCDHDGGMAYVAVFCTRQRVRDIALRSNPFIPDKVSGFGLSIDKESSSPISMEELDLLDH